MATIRYRVSNEEVAIFAIHLNLQEESDRKETSVFAVQNKHLFLLFKIYQLVLWAQDIATIELCKCLLSSCVVSYLTVNF